MAETTFHDFDDEPEEIDPLEGLDGDAIAFEEGEFAGVTVAELLKLRAWYLRLSPSGRTAFSSRKREGKAKYFTTQPRRGGYSPRAEDSELLAFNPAPEAVKTIGKFRHWKQRFDPNAAFVFRRALAWPALVPMLDEDGEPMADANGSEILVRGEKRIAFPAGAVVPQWVVEDMGVAKLRRWWESKWIELYHFENPNVAVGRPVMADTRRPQDRARDEAAKAPERDEEALALAFEKVRSLESPNEQDLEDLRELGATEEEIEALGTEEAPDGEPGPELTADELDAWEQLEDFLGDLPEDDRVSFEELEQHEDRVAFVENYRAFRQLRLEAFVADLDEDQRAAFEALDQPGKVRFVLEADWILEDDELDPNEADDEEGDGGEQQTEEPPPAAATVEVGQNGWYTITADEVAVKKRGRENALAHLAELGVSDPEALLLEAEGGA